MPTQTLKLNKPIIRGENQVTEITLHAPNVGAMRGVSMRALLDLHVDALLPVLPRISDPKLTEQEVEKLDPSDLLQAGVLVASFFLPESEQQDVV